MISTYREWPAPAPAGVVRCCWEQQIGRGLAGHIQRVLPDACADLVVTEDGHIVLVGPTTGVAFAHLRPGSTVRGLRFEPASVAAALGIPGSEFRNRTIPLDSVLTMRKAEEAAEAIWSGAAPGWAKPREPDGRVSSAMGTLWHSPQADIAAVADGVGLSARQLRRLLITETGLGPKTVQRVGRLHRFLRLAEGGRPWRGLASLAAEAGYADQAHMTRDVRDLGGTTPARLLAERAVASS